MVLGEMRPCGQWQETHKMSLEHLIVPKSKEVLKQTIKQRHEKNKTQYWKYVKETQEPTERPTNAHTWNNLSNGINKVASDYNPKYKISIQI